MHDTPFLIGQQKDIGIFLYAPKQLRVIENRGINICKYLVLPVNVKLTGILAGRQGKEQIGIYGLPSLKDVTHGLCLTVVRI